MIATRTISIRWMVIWASVATARGVVNRQNPRGFAFASRSSVSVSPGSTLVPSARTGVASSSRAASSGGTARADVLDAWCRRIQRSHSQAATVRGI